MNRMIAATVAAVIALAGCAASDTSEPPASTRAAESTTTTTGLSEGVPDTPSTTSPVESVQAVELQPARVEAALGYMTAVASTDAGFVAGGASTVGDQLDAAVWMSADGRQWSAVAAPDVGDDQVGEAQVDEWIASVAVSADGFVAGGAAGPTEDRDAALWTSGDGVAWNRVDDPDLLLSGDGHQLIHAVAWLDGTAVAVGEANGGAAAWVAEDGAWEHGQIVESAALDESVMTDVMPGGPGLVAAGSVGHEAMPAVWLSSDGATWTRVEDLPASDWLLTNVWLGDWSGRHSPSVSLAATAGGFVLIGSASTGPVVWTSPDGLTWTDAAATFIDEPSPTRPAGPFDYLKRGVAITIADVAWFGERLVAVGGYRLAFSASKLPRFVTVWSSSDGGTTWHAAGEWTMEPSDSQQWRGATALTTKGSVLALVGMGEMVTGEDQYGYLSYGAALAAWFAEE